MLREGSPHWVRSTIIPKHLLDIYSVPDLRLGSGIQEGTIASNLECPSLLPPPPPSL